MATSRGVDPAEGRRPRLGATTRASTYQRYEVGYDRAISTMTKSLSSFSWAPYRTWVSLLLRVNLEDSTHKISAPSASSRG